jgi:hypothetical protein
MGVSIDKKLPPGLKPKDLVGIPWRVAFALQADGWYLRSDIIWSKPNPMPESVTDRPTKSHEYLFLFAKSERYYFDQEAVREPGQDWSKGGPGTGITPTTHYHPENGGNAGLSSLAGRYKTGEQQAGRNIRSVWTVATTPYGSVTRDDAGGPSDTLSPDCPVHSLRAIRRTLQTAGDDGLLDHLRSRSRRTVTRPAPERGDEQQPSFRLDSSDDRPAMTGSVLLDSSQLPTETNGHASRTPALPTDGDALASIAGTADRTSRSEGSAMSQDGGGLPDQDAPSATGRNGHGSRTSEPFDGPGSTPPAPSSDTPDIAARPEAGEPRCSCPDNTMSHFATFPPKLVEPCIKAGTSERGVCPECGAPWRRTTEVVGYDRQRWAPGEDQYHTQSKGKHGATSSFTTGDVAVKQTTGWQPSCAHAAEPIPATLLDCFAGSGTVGTVAQSLSRRAVLIDLNPEYIEQQLKRNAQTPLGLTG